MNNLTKSVYTVRTLHNKFFVFHVKQAANTSMVAFQKQEQAIHMARLLELHREISGEWPNTDFTDGAVFDFYGKGIAVDDMTLKQVEIVTWQEDDLIKFCSNNMLDIIRVDTFEQGANDSRAVFSGSFIHLEASLSFKRSYLEKKLKEPPV